MDYPKFIVYQVISSCLGKTWIFFSFIREQKVLKIHVFCCNFRWLLLCVKLIYFQSAIAASINLRSKLELVLNQDGQVNVDLPAVGITRSWTVQEIAEHLTLPLGKMSSSFAPAKNNYAYLTLVFLVLNYSPLNE